MIYIIMCKSLLFFMFIANNLCFSNKKIDRSDSFFSQKSSFISLFYLVFLVHIDFYPEFSEKFGFKTIIKEEFF